MDFNLMVICLTAVLTPYSTSHFQMQLSGPTRSDGLQFDGYLFNSCIDTLQVILPTAANRWQTYTYRWQGKEADGKH